MKKSMRALAFVLVLMLTIAIFAIPATAATANCPSCSRSVTIPESGWRTYDTTSCGHSSTGRHYFQNFSGNVTCPTCGRIFYVNKNRTWCTSVGEC